MEITSVSDFIKQCFDNPALKKADTEVFYRGVHQIFPRQTRHVPSLYYPPNYFYQKESLIFKEALAYLPELLLPQASTIERLIMMEHYRFPTRIMDMGKNPLANLFFACFADISPESKQKDGIVYVYEVPHKEIKYCDSDAVSIVANLCKCNDDFDVSRITQYDYEDFNKDAWVCELIHNIHEEKPYFDNVAEPQTLNSVICLRPRMNNPRIIRQDGCFFLFGINGKKENCAKLKDEWISEREFIIPYDKKDAILKELEMLNINEAFIYPDYEHINNFIRKSIQAKAYKKQKCLYVIRRKEYKMTKKRIALIAVMMVCGAAVFAQSEREVKAMMNKELEKIVADKLGVKYENNKSDSQNILKAIQALPYGREVDQYYLNGDNVFLLSALFRRDGTSGLASAAAYLGVEPNVEAVQKAVNDTKNNAAIAAFKKKDYAGVAMALIQAKVEPKLLQWRVEKEIVDSIFADTFGLKGDWTWSKNVADAYYRNTDYIGALRECVKSRKAEYEDNTYYVSQDGYRENVAKYLGLDAKANAKTVQAAVEATKNNAAIAAFKKKNYADVVIALVQPKIELKVAEMTQQEAQQGIARSVLVEILGLPVTADDSDMSRKLSDIGSKIVTDMERRVQYVDSGAAAKAFDANRHTKRDYVNTLKTFLLDDGGSGLISTAYYLRVEPKAETLQKAVEATKNQQAITALKNKDYFSVVMALAPSREIGTYDELVKRTDIPQVSLVDTTIDENSIPNIEAVKIFLKKIRRSNFMYVSPDHEKEYYLITYQRENGDDIWSFEKHSVVQNYMTAKNTAPSYYVSPYGDNSNDGLSPETPFKTLRKASIAMRTGTVKTITVIGDIQESLALEGLGGGEILITGFDGRINDTVSFADKFNTTKLRFANVIVKKIYIQTASTVTLDEGTVVESFINNTTPVIMNNIRCYSITNNSGTFTMRYDMGTHSVDVNGGTFTMTDNAVIKDSNRKWSNKSGVITVSNGVFNMLGNAKITGTKGFESYFGSNIVNYTQSIFCIGKGQVNLSGSASISDNNGVAIACDEGGTVTISENVVIANNKGQAIRIYRNSTANIKGGKITGHNTSGKGGGGAIWSYGTLTMSGGEISGNKTDSYGGGVYAGGGTFTLTGGNITGNTAGDSGGGVYVAGAVYNARGGTVTGNIAIDGEGNDVLK